MRVAVISDMHGNDLAFEVSLEFRRIPFDARELIRIYQESGRPFAEEASAQYQE